MSFFQWSLILGKVIYQYFFFKDSSGQGVDVSFISQGMQFLEFFDKWMVKIWMIYRFL